VRFTLRRRLLAAATFLVLLLVSALAFADQAPAADAGIVEKLFATGPFGAMLASFVGGVLASLTPCVYPMIIITVSIFGAQEAKSRWHAAALSGTFVLGLVTLFTGLGVAAALSGKLLGSTAANPWVTIPMAMLLLVLAASMFGAFELTLPASVTNKLSSIGGVGYKGAFGLGMVCSLLAAPCTGPVMAAIATKIAEKHDVVFGVLVMSSFGFGLGLLFFIVGTFATSLPKGGAWMLGVKWIFGVLLSYLALAYIRDSTTGLKSLAIPGARYGVIVGAVLLVGLALAAVHVAAERRRSPIAHLSKPMKLASILPAVSGLFLLITWYQIPTVETSNGVPEITWLTDEAAARKLAAAENKPIMIDFGAAWCAACKELEEKTFPSVSVRKEGARFVAVKVDGTDDEAPSFVEMKEKYKIVGLPTTIFLDHTGKEVTRRNGFLAPDEFTKVLQSVD
jgi:thioredoxin:protein disulfide reductase